MINEPPSPKPPSPPFLPYCALSVLLLRRAHVQAHVLGRVLLHKEHGLVTAALNTITISSSECERGFSQMNPILNSTRSSLLVQTMSAMMFIRMVGPPLTQFNPKKYMESWLLRGHFAVDTKSKKQAREEEDTSENMLKVWALL